MLYLNLHTNLHTNFPKTRRNKLKQMKFIMLIISHLYPIRKTTENDLSTPRRITQKRLDEIHRAFFVIRPAMGSTGNYGSADFLGGKTGFCHPERSRRISVCAIGRSFDFAQDDKIVRLHPIFCFFMLKTRQIIGQIHSNYRR